MNRRSKALAALTSLLLSSCSLQTVSTADRVNGEAMGDAARRMDEARQPLRPDLLSSVRVEDGIFTTATAHRSDRGEPLPRKWEREDGFVIQQATLMPLFEIGTKITDVTGIPVEFAPDVFEAMGSATATGAPAPGGTAGPMGLTAPAPPNLNSMLGTMGLSGPTAAGNTAGASGNMIRPISGTRAAMKVDFKGRLSSFLNQVSTQFGVAWEYSGGQVRVFKNATRTYTIHALPATIVMSSALTADSAAASGGGGGSSGGVSGGSNQKIANAVNIDTWKDIGNAVTTLVGSFGKVSSSVSTGTITVTAPPSVLAKVETYVSGQNARLARQVTVSVQVLNVAVTDDDNATFDLAGALKDATRYGFAFGNAASTAASAISAGTPGIALNILKPTGTAGQLSGTSGIISALSTKGKVTVKTTANLTTANGVPAPLQIANTRGFVQTITVSNGVSAGTSTNSQNTTITPGTVTTGFSMSLLPRIDPDGQGLLMQFGISMSELNGPTDGFRQFSAGGNTIQLPDINSRNFVQQAFVPNGATLVLAGFEQTQDHSTHSGMGMSDFWALGGGQTGQHERNIIVILMSPVVVSQQLPLITSD